MPLAASQAWSSHPACHHSPVASGRSCLSPARALGLGGRLCCTRRLRAPGRPAVGAASSCANNGEKTPQATYVGASKHAPRPNICSLLRLIGIRNYIGGFGAPQLHSPPRAAARLTACPTPSAGHRQHLTTERSQRQPQGRGLQPQPAVLPAPTPLLAGPRTRTCGPASSA